VSYYYEIWGRDGPPGTAPLELLWRSLAPLADRKEAETILEDYRRRGFSDLELRVVGI
jgi:hypothetical protein